MASIGSREPVRRVLVAGIARSGTTWITHALRECSDVSLVHEPDNDRLHPEAAVAKADLGLYPLLRPGDPAPAYARLFRAAYGDAVPGPATGGATVVKSVHAALALDWLLTEVPVDAGLVVVRHPANVIGSWRDLGWSAHAFPWNDERLWAAVADPGRHPGEPGTFVERAAWQFAFLADALVRTAGERGLTVVDHEDVLADPVARLRDVAARLGLEWTDAASTWVSERDRAGQGYEIERVAAEERGRWRTRLDPDDLSVVAGVVGRFPSLAGRWELPRPAPGPHPVAD